ncbi:MAG: type ISP restriction/modification enzyme [Sandaracinaceae bacterium]
MPDEPPQASERGAGEEAVRAAEERDRSISDALRTTRGVVHTPLPVARFVVDRVVRALDGWGDLAHARVVDPACGPGVFLAAAVERGARRLTGFDVDPDAVERARAVLGPHAGSELRLSTRNTLSAPLSAEPGPLVLIGNPPWSGRTANAGVSYTDGLLAGFRQMPDGAPLNERKVGVLSDDYVRFFAWAAEQARCAEDGAVLGLVTNASYLDGPVHRAMRAALLGVFDRVEVVDLGGSALIARRGERDENVFGVRPAASIAILERRPGASRPPEVRYTRVWGSREAKLTALASLPEADLIEARAPQYRWVPAPQVPEHYARWVALPDLVPFHREGVQTNRDAMCIDADADALIARLRRFAGGDDDMPGRAAIPSGHYDPAQARRTTATALAAGDAVRPIAYRPLDPRHVAVVPRLCHRPRRALLAAVERSAFCLLTVRKDRGERAWRHAAASRCIADNCFISTRSSCRTRVFPTHDAAGALNLDRAVFGALVGDTGAAPDDALAYVLGVIAARTYQDTYGPALMVDYPRIPPPPDRARFDAVAAAGRRLVSAFEATPVAGERPVTVGHHSVESDALARAFEACEAAATPILGSRVDGPVQLSLVGVVED